MLSYNAQMGLFPARWGRLLRTLPLCV